MKYIMKNGCPTKYAHWCREVAGTEKEDFNEIPNGVKQELMDILIEEQGFICGYTMKKIDKDSAHIEHIKPQSLCRKEKQGLDLDYRNLIACYPRVVKRTKPSFGAIYKGNWWEKSGKDFVSPLDFGCESHFHFDLDGNITSSSIAAATTIKVLALDDRSLTEMRKRIIHEYIFSPNFTKNKAIRAISSICNERDGEGHYHEFCVAIRDVLIQYVKFSRN